jgi:hypothetical protein
MDVNFYFNNYNAIIKLSKFYLSRTNLSLQEIIKEEALKNNIQLNIDNIIIYDFHNDKTVSQKDDIINDQSTKYKIIIKPIICNCPLISKY